jgi:hypothetical protein
MYCPGATAVGHPVKAKETAKKVLATEASQPSKSVRASGFKKSKNLEKRLKEQHQLPQYQPWASLSAATEKKSLPSREEQKQAVARYKVNYDSSFVPAASHESEQLGGQRGNTIFIKCRNIHEETLKQAFSSFGIILPVKSKLIKISKLGVEENMNMSHVISVQLYLHTVSVVWMVYIW